jgi:hypothetical protein
MQTEFLESRNKVNEDIARMNCFKTEGVKLLEPEI